MDYLFIKCTYTNKTIETVNNLGGLTNSNFMTTEDVLEDIRKLKNRGNDNNGERLG